MAYCTLDLHSAIHSNDVQSEGVDEGAEGVFRRFRMLLVATDAPKLALSDDY
jgi:hypothetical protein